MKFREIFRYELIYQLRRPWTWLFFIALLVISFLMTRDNALAEALFDDFFVNSPFAIAKTTIVGSLFWLLTAAAVAGDAAARDVSTLMSPLVYTSPISKTQYLAGRFLSALTINILLLFTVQIGIFLGIYLPGIDPAVIGPFRPLAFLSCFAILALPNAIAGTAVQFALAMSTGRPMVAYLGSFMLFMMSYVVGLFLVFNGHKELANILDPVGVHFILSDLSYQWTPIEKSYRLITLEGVVLTNRLLWIGVGLISCLITFVTFKFKHRISFGLRVASWLRITLPSFSQAPVWVSFSTVATSWPGIFMLVLIPFMMIPVVIDQMEMNGVPLLPVTIRVIGELTAPISAELSRWVVIPILIIFFTGELVWRERNAGIHEITDAIPRSEWRMLLDKFIGLCIALALFMALLIITSMLAQTILDYDDYEVGLYITILFGLQLPEYILFAILALAIHVIVDQKYISTLLAIVAYALIAVAPMFGIEHNMLIYTGGPSWSYTDMRGFGTSIGPWLWFKLYWASWGLLIAVVARLFWVRGKENTLKARWNIARRRFTGVTALVASVGIILVISFGGFIFYNTNILNDYLTEHDIKKQKAEYERSHKNEKRTEKPVTKVILNIDIQPEHRTASIHGTYLFIDSTSREFETTIASKGFTEHGIDNPIVPNGTRLLLEDYLPPIGYQAGKELISPSDRREFGLPAQPLVPSLYDAEARKHRDPGIQFEAIISTSEDQVAVTPGALIRSWTDNHRRYFHYKTSAPIGTEWPLFSARYEMSEENWNRPDTGHVRIQIFHHPGHTSNITRLLDGMRASLAYYSKEFGRYPYEHLTLIEHPGNGSGMHADASIISFSEGFSSWVPKDPRTVDLPYAVAAHEMGHQWNVPYANVEGAPIMSESVAWYYGMKLVQHARGEDEFQKLLAFMRMPYPYPPIHHGEPLLRGLDPYLSYRRGPFALYAVSEYIGEQKVNRALKDLLKHHAPDHTPLATTLDLYRELGLVTPDSLHYLLHDLFEVNTYWGLAVKKASWIDKDSLLALDIGATKTVTDSAGVESSVPLNDWIEVGVYDDKGQIYLRKHYFTKQEQSLIISLPSRPVRAVIDPRNLLIDLNTNDNRIDVNPG